jgi:hypothetical protein
MDWKPFARGSAACSLPFAVLCGEEKQHLHVGVFTDPPGVGAAGDGAEAGWKGPSHRSVAFRFDVPA